MSRIRFIHFYKVMQVLIVLATLQNSKSIKAIEWLGLTNFYERHVASMIGQTFFDVNTVKGIVNLLLVYSIISLLINGTFYIIYKKLVRSNKIFVCIRVEELVRDLVMVAMRILILGCSIILMAPTINLVLIETIGTDGGIAEILMGRYAATMIVIGITLSFSGVVGNFAQKGRFKIGFEKV